MFLKNFTVSMLTLSMSVVYAQTITVEPVDVLYGNQVFRGEHQIVRSSPDDVTIIPAEAPNNQDIVNMVVSSNPRKSSYLEESLAADREQAIYEEVNRRTREAPFTVLFTGNIPEEIQQRRLSMMPEVGIFGDQLEKLERDQQALNPDDDPVVPDEGQFSEVTPGNQVFGGQAPATPANDATGTENQAELSDEQKLEQLIGG